MDNSIYHNGRKVTDEFDNRKLQRVAHPPYSPDLSPCDFWLLGMLKQKMKDRELSEVEEITNAV
jgi:transposase